MAALVSLENKWCYTKEFLVADSSSCIVYLLKVLARACSRCSYKLYCLIISTAIICSHVYSDFWNGYWSHNYWSWFKDCMFLIPNLKMSHWHSICLYKDHSAKNKYTYYTSFFVTLNVTKEQNGKHVYWQRQSRQLPLFCGFIHVLKNLHVHTYFGVKMVWHCRRT